MAGYYKNSDGGYSVNYDDQRFQDVKNEQTQKENEVNSTYDNILNNSDKYYQDQINATKEYEKKQSELQQAQTDFALEQINQQKEQSQKDYTKEQKGSYVDYMRQTKSNAQNMANSGLSNTGFSESSIVSMYNAYQNRVSSAKENLNKATLNYNNSIQQAILANNEKLAEIAFNSLQTQNQLNQQAFEYKNSVILQKQEALQKINDTYYARYQNVLAQINSEIELQMELDKIDREYDQWVKEFNEKNRQWWANFEAQDRQWKKEMSLKERELALKQQETKANIAYTNAKIAELKSSSNPYGNDTSKKNNNRVQKLYKNLNNMNLKNNMNKKVAQNLIYGEVKNGNISETDAEKMFNDFGL